MEQIVLSLLATIGLTLDEATKTYKCQAQLAAPITCIYKGLKRSHPHLVGEAEDEAFRREAATRAEDFAM